LTQFPRENRFTLFLELPGIIPFHNWPPGMLGGQLFVIGNVCGRVIASLMAGGDGPGVDLSAQPLVWP
jgi:hypothetical protein